MIKLIITIVTFLIGLVSVAQVTENREVASFTKIKASNGIEVVYTISATKNLKVETDDNDRLSLIKTKVTNGILKIYVDTKGYKENSNKKTKKLKSVNTVNGVHFQVLKVMVSGPHLESIDADSAAKITISPLNKTTNLELKLSSSGSVIGKFNCVNANITTSSSADLAGELTAKKVSVSSSSASNISLKGNVEELNVMASSAADCDFKNLITNEVEVKASSTANVSVNAIKKISAEATSSADIVYYGNPAQVYKKESALGSISAK